MKMNSYRFFGSALLLACLAGTALAQQPGFTPQKAPATINSTYAEINPLLSPDGSELYFVRVNHPANGYGEGDSQDIWYSKKGPDGEWSEAVRIPELNLGRYNSVVGFVDGGKTLMLMGRFTQDGAFWSKRGFSLVSRSESGQWGAPRPVQIASYARKNKGLYSAAHLSADGNQLLMSYHKRHNSKRSDLFVSQAQANGKFSAPKKIRTLDDDDELAPFLSADGKTLYYTSNRDGSQDILVAERQGDDWRTWTPTKLPNEAVNTSGWEAYFRTNTQGSTGYYAAKQGSEQADIYFVKLYEENPYILVSGRVLNKQSGQALTNASGLRLFANDSLQQSLTVNADGTYSVKLPLGQVYTLRPELSHHKAQALTIAADSLKEYTETKADLYLTPWHFVEVSGKLRQRDPQVSMPANVPLQLLVNGQPADSVVLNAQTGEYQLWLPWGKNYSLKLQAEGFVAEPLDLKLAGVTGYQALKHDLFAQQIRSAVVQGRVLDRKTGKEFAAGIPVQIMLNDTLQLATDSLGGTYEVKLPVGKAYTISAKAEGYYPMSEMIALEGEKEAVKIYRDLYLAPLEVGQSIRLNNVFFEHGKATLMEASFQELDRVVAFLMENPNMKIEIAGHTDTTGKAATNNKLSTDRANAVSKYIYGKGIAADRLTSRGYGSTKPEADNKTEEGRSRNRRVEFTILEIVKM